MVAATGWMPKSTRVLACTTALCVLGCSGADHGRGLPVGREPASSGGTGFGTLAGSGGAPAGGQAGGTSSVGSGENALTVRVEDRASLEIEIITLQCAGDCAEVEAVARGGNPPYTFAWNDGSTDALRRLCPTAATTFEVTATDTAIEADEFRYEAQTATAELSATVLDCATDAGVPADLDCFLENPSFEGTPAVGLGDLGAALPHWSVCWATPDVNPSFSNLPASDGSTYLGAVGNESSANFSESAGAAFCTPLQAAQPVSFTVDIAMSSYIGGAGALELWGGATPCSKDELLWTSPVITETDQWRTFCGTLTPSQDFPYLVLWPVAGIGGAYVLTDNFRPAVSCE